MRLFVDHERRHLRHCNENVDWVNNYNYPSKILSFKKRTTISSQQDSVLKKKKKKNGTLSKMTR